MKFSELDEAGWPDLQPYFDTCLLPVTGLSGREAPFEMADRLADAGAWLSPLEQTFKGRTVTLPALHYYDGGDEDARKLQELCGKFREDGFRYVVLISGRPGLLKEDLGADLIVQPKTDGETPDPHTLRQAISVLWKNPAAAGVPASRSGQP